MTQQMPIKVMIVDDHSVVRRGLRFFLLAFDDMELVGEADNGESAVALCDQVQPDVILMDMKMPGMDGAVATRKIMERHPHVRIIALTSFKDETLVQNALLAGAVSYLLKDVTDEELIEAIRSAYAGRATLRPEIARALVLATAQPACPGSDLTNREREVLALLVEGLTNVEIAKRLVISRSTARYHVSNILSKLGVSNRVEATALAIQKNLV